jgi:predicted XRE-type DNA-binding protein
MTRAKVTRGSGNVFADLGFADAAERQTKTRLALAVAGLLKARRLKQVESASILGVPQPKISALLNFRLDGFSVEKLMDFLTALNQDVEISIKPRRKGTGCISVVSHADT